MISIEKIAKRSPLEERTEVATTFPNGEDIIKEINRVTYEIYLIDYRLPTNNNGIDVAINIIIKFPSARILFITGYEHLQNELSKNTIFMVGPLY